MSAAKIERSWGTTPSERYLARLGERSFLRLWSYPNAFIDKWTDKSKKQGKELCDLLVVCGDHVVVFSDKSIDFQSGQSLEIAWTRWYRRAVAKSISQVNGAKRWLTNFPERIFIDAACTARFPIPIPSQKQMKFHGVVVALGSAKACQEYFGEGSGSLIVASERHVPVLEDGTPPPFSVIASEKAESFVHVFDDVSLDVVLRELDTISDFVDYLEKKERFVCSGNFGWADGEEELLASFLKEVNSDGEHDFLYKSHEKLDKNDVLSFGGGIYAAMRKNPLYVRKKRADRISYVWDRLIDKFAKHIMDGTSVVVEGFEDLASNNSNFELGIRHLALVPRLMRRAHGEAIIGAFDKIGLQDRLFRAMLPGPTERDQSTGFFILLMKRMSKFVKELDYNQYRMLRSKTLYAYALNLLRLNPALE